MITALDYPVPSPGFDEDAHGTMAVLMIERMAGNTRMDEFSAGALWKTLPEQGKSFFVRRYFAAIGSLAPQVESSRH